MKRTPVLATLLLATLAVSATADTITTARGRVYTGAKIKQVDPDGISFTHSDGAAKILFTDLPASMREKYGYDPKKASAYAKKITEQRKEAAKRREEYLRREAEVIEAAQFASTMAALQQQNAMLAQMQRPNYVTGFAPVAGYYNGLQGWPTTQITGPAVDGRPYRPRSWGGIGIAPLVPGTGGIYAPSSGGFAYYPPFYPALGYARPGYSVGANVNFFNGAGISIGLGAAPALAPTPFVPPPAVVPGISVSGGGFVIPHHH